ncbi:MAG TPA: DUF2726 domain-containing protein [Caldilinea sp.]|nr:DUF2726 domain-containing protein [Caldilinea sp.]
MSSQGKFSVLRSILRTLGLSQEAVDEIVDRIVDFLSADEPSAADKEVYPYALRDDFLSPAELSFYRVLATVVDPEIRICTKVALGDLFYAKIKDSSDWRRYTNKIDRKHVDFLLCDGQTMRPLAGIELDDSSHRREDRQARDHFVNRVFATAALPLIRVPARRGYAPVELRAVLGEWAAEEKTAEPVAESTPARVDAVYDKKPAPSPAPPPTPTPKPATTAPVSPSPQITQPASAAALPGTSLFGPPPVVDPVEPAPPRCPKCGDEMVLRTAKSGANSGGQFWGCTNYPKCRGIVQYQPTAN